MKQMNTLTDLAGAASLLLASLSPAFSAADPSVAATSGVVTNYVTVTNIVVVTNYIVTTNLVLATNALGRAKGMFSVFPLAPPEDGFDWIELRSGEWLKGKIKSLQDEKLEFDSEELDVHTWDWKDIRTVRSPRLNSVRFEDKTTSEGSVLVTTNQVRVITETSTNTYPRSELLAITPTGKREIDKWSADISAGMGFRSGNTKEVEYNAHIMLERRTPSTRLSLDYLGNFGSISNVQTENNHRATLGFDSFLSRRLYLRIPDIEYYSDPFLNLEHRLTLGGGVGYDFIHTRNLEWNVTVGPAWQRNWYHSVEDGQSQTSDGTAFVVGSRFDWDITRRIELILEYRSQIMSREQGDNSHHAAATLEFEIHKRLTLDLSFVWDRIAAPAKESDGNTPSTDDVRLNLAFGVKF